MSRRQDKARSRAGARADEALRTRDARAALELAARRLEHMFEIGKLFARFEDTDQPLDPALAIIASSLPLLSAILIEIHGDSSRMIVWASPSRSSEQMRAVKTHAEEACSYLVPSASTAAGAVSEQAGKTPLPWRAESSTLGGKLIVIPLVVAQRPSFGILQLEAAQPVDRTDLMFVNAIANQLAIALDREHAWQQDIALRAAAERAKELAEVARAAAEQARTSAECAREKYEALATENARLYEQAQRAVRAREEILAIVSHDLKNPLGAILLLTSILEQKTAPHEEPSISQALGKIERSAKSMLRLISDLLDFASIDAGHLAINCQPHDPAALIQDTLANFASIAQRKRIELTAYVESTLPSVVCDRERIRQVLDNLVGNATNATAEGGHVKLRVSLQGDEVVFEIADDGPGISQEDVAHLFERYWRSGHASYQGTGLGLAIASEIVTAHGSRIHVDSQPGRGTTFYFALPTS
jgi:signal transduction histidine kinase